VSHCLLVRALRLGPVVLAAAAAAAVAAAAAAAAAAAQATTAAVVLLSRAVALQLPALLGAAAAPEGARRQWQLVLLEPAAVLGCQRRGLAWLARWLVVLPRGAVARRLLAVPQPVAMVAGAPGATATATATATA
jgi:hypothetical protein